jgi:hypothetical protein
MEERRRLQRTRVLRNAKIILGYQSSMICCTLHNLTSVGACLSVANATLLPDSFELTFEQGRTRRQCRVIWRTQTRLGIAFEAVPVDAVPTG